MTVVVDLTTGIAGAYCSKVLRDLGHTVVRAEDDADSALMRFLRRGIGVDPTIDQIDLDTADLVIANSRVACDATLVVITPFGLDTPWSDKPATEFTLQAWSGGMIGLGRGYM